MVRVVTLTVLLVAVALPLVAADPGDEILGLWATDPAAEGGLSHVEITKRDGKYFAAIRWLAKPVYPPDDKGGMGGLAKVDRNNPDPAKRSVPSLGLEVMKDFVYLGDGHWGDGTIYDPDNGKTYKCKATLGEDGNLHVRGYIGFSLLGRTTVWTRPASSDGK
jgi:uncharacterized protein (DUF2147 family)